MAVFHECSFVVGERNHRGHFLTLGFVAFRIIGHGVVSPNLDLRLSLATNISRQRAADIASYSASSLKSVGCLYVCSVDVAMSNLSSTSRQRKCTFLSAGAVAQLHDPAV